MTDKPEAPKTPKQPERRSVPHPMYPPGSGDVGKFDPPKPVVPPPAKPTK